MGKILLINEQEKIRDYINQVLVSANHEVEVLEDTLAIFDRVLQSRPDLVILDINLKYVDGLFLVERLLSMEESPGLPVLVISSENEFLMLLDSIEKGASDYIPFPIKAEALTTKVDEIISKSKNLAKPV